MLALDPAPAVKLADMDLIAYDAARTPDGLAATVGAVNGACGHLRAVLLADPADRAAYAAEVGAVVPTDAAGIAAGLIKLHNLAEGALRRVEAKQPPAPKVAAPWPAPLAEEAYHGLAGAFVQTVLPHSEADPAALLGQFLVAFGSIVGRGPHAVVEADRHGANEFACLVGETAKGRKGTSLGPVQRTFAMAEEHLAADPERKRWSTGCQSSGLSSGEGVVWAVRDPITTRQPVKERGRVVDYEDVETDPGVIDKRLLIIEGEFAQALKVLAREGNTLSPVIRNAWDTGTLRVLTKNSPAQATDAHISIIGHVTRDELLRDLRAVEGANGFANRFLWLCVRRSKCLPEGGGLADDVLGPLALRLAHAVAVARTIGELRRDDDARAVWAEVYPALSEGKPGLFGAVTARAEAHALRLSCLYALLDGSAVVRRSHLLAALALWDYAEGSARYIFGDATGDDLADMLLAALREAPVGLTRNDIFTGVLKNNHPAADITGALEALERDGKARVERRTPEAGRGRPVERWFATD